MVETSEVINGIMMHLSHYNTDQQEEIRNVLQMALCGLDITRPETALINPEDQDLTLRAAQMFLIAKRVEGCTPRTLSYYGSEVRKFALAVAKPWSEVRADDIRLYIAKMAIERHVSKTTQDNVVRILRSFFGWLVAEDYIGKSPMAKIKAVKKERRIKKPFSEIEIERLRNGARDLRERAMIDILLSTGMRIGELSQLNRRDIEGDQCVVYGKGQKERYVYFNAKAVVSIDAYLKTRVDDHEALFVTFSAPYKRLKISGFESRLRELGRELGIDNVHPHRFRRTAATLALNRGMPIEQVQQMLGHEQIETTLIYAAAAQDNIKASHKKYVL